jgi:exodeoxyribonuclease V gamma subunit
MLHIHYSHRTERLAAALAEVLRERDERMPVLTPDIVVVNNAGMGRWLQLEVARNNGIAANVQTRFPAELVWDLLRSTIPNLPERSPFDPELLTWHLFRLFDEISTDSRFREIGRYLEGHDDYRQWSLARRLAGIFDQYVVYRPDWIHAWESGSDKNWQAALWRLLTDRLSKEHWASLHQKFTAIMAAKDVDTAHLPGRICVFGIPSLSPAYLDILRSVSRFTTVHLFWFNPCRQYWAEIVPARVADGDTKDRYMERGNSLLANWGLQGRDTLYLLQDLGAEEFEDFEPADGDTLLASIQNDILDLVDRGEQGPVSWPDPDDQSIAIHACHGPMREVEVLHDQLLHRFAQEPSLMPSDVLVMTPDMDTYAPIIDAVFSTAPAHLRIPFSIADRSLRARLPEVDAFLSLLELPQQRMTPEYVLSLLQTDAIRAAFDLTESDINVIRGWIDSVAIRWGFDAAHRQRLGLPATGEHTWRAGLDRLLLGYAMPVDVPFADVLPWPEIESSDARILGRFSRLLSLLDSYAQQLSRPRTLRDWTAGLMKMLDVFFVDNAQSNVAVQYLRDAIDELGASAQDIMAERGVPFQVVRSCLEARVDTASDRAGFIDGGVTFCSMVPMRSIPFSLICVIGLDDGAFPRMSTPSTLDRMSRDYRLGDRSRRDDDRYVFLEALMSARNSFYISYKGRNIKDNSRLPPSVVVSDLLDYIGQGLVDRDSNREKRREQLVDRLVTTHPLQGFNGDYFRDNPRLPGYVPYLADAANAAGNPAPAATFLATRLEAPADDLVDIEDLKFFFTNPARQMLRERLNVWLDERDSTHEDREPFMLDYNGSEAICLSWLTQYADQQDLDGCEASLRRQGLLPHGIPGRVCMESAISSFEPVRHTIAEILKSEVQDRIAIDLVINRIRLGGWLEGMRGEGLCRYYLRNAQARDRIGILIEHLVVSAMNLNPGKASRLITLNASYTLDPLKQAQARKLLRPWLEMYREGQCAPLRFFPRAAWTWFDCIDKPDRLDKARRTWEGSLYSVGEGTNEYYRKVFGDANPIDDEFDAIANRLLGPAVNFMHTEKS